MVRSKDAGSRVCPRLPRDLPPPCHWSPVIQLMLLSSTGASHRSRVSNRAMAPEVRASAQREPLAR